MVRLIIQHVFWMSVDTFILAVFVCPACVLLSESPLFHVSKRTLVRLLTHIVCAVLSIINPTIRICLHAYIYTRERSTCRRQNAGNSLDPPHTAVSSAANIGTTIFK